MCNKIQCCYLPTGYITSKKNTLKCENHPQIDEIGVKPVLYFSIPHTSSVLHVILNFKLRYIFLYFSHIVFLVPN